MTFLIRNLSSFFPFYIFALQKKVNPLLIISHFWLVWSKLIKAFLHSAYFVLTFCFDPISADFSWILCDRLHVCRTKSLKCVCTGRKSKLCSCGCCHFLCWQKCLTVVKWWHCEGSPQFPVRKKKYLGWQKGHSHILRSFYWSGGPSRNQIEKKIGKVDQHLLLSLLNMTGFNQEGWTGCGWQSPPIWEERCPNIDWENH